MMTAAFLEGASVGWSLGIVVGGLIGWWRLGRAGGGTMYQDSEIGP